MDNINSATGALINTPSNFSGNLSNSIQNGNAFSQTLPNNVSRVLVVVNASTVAIDNARSQILTLSTQFPSIDFAISTRADGLLNNGQVGFILNPTNDFVNGRNYNNYVVPFASPLLPSAPILPLPNR